MRVKTCVALYELPVTVITKDRKPGNLENLEFILSQPEGQKFEIKVWAGLCPPQALGEEPSRHFRLLQAAGRSGPFTRPSYRDASFGFKAHPNSV